MARRKIDIEKIVQEYSSQLEKMGIKPEKIILYGSYAIGRTHAGSDIDLVVISRDFDRLHPLKRLELLSLATAKMDAPIEALGYSPEDIEKRGQDSIFWDIIKKTGRTVLPTK